jgi:HD-like signal output (HDOD) protein
MKAPAKAKGKMFKCVRCGELIRAGDAPGPAAAEEPSAHVEAAMEPIGQLLVKEGLIGETQLRSALEVQRQQGGKLLELLIQLGHLTKERLHDFLSKQPGVAAIDLARLSLDRSLMELIPKDIALGSLVLPIDRLGKLLTVAMACPLDIVTIREIEKLTGLRVKAMLCKLDDIHTAVRRYYPSHGPGGEDMHVFQMPENMAAAPRDDVSDRIAQLESLGVAQNTLLALDELSGDPESTVRDFAEVAACDPQLAAVLLCTANRAAYGMAGQVDNLWGAVALLGRYGVVQVARSSSGDRGGPGVRLEPVITRARRCAAAAAALARQCGRMGAGVAFTAGLLHQMGCLALAKTAGEKYARVDLNLPGDALAETEKTLFSMPHPQVGEKLAARWHYPVLLAQSIGGYLAPSKVGLAQDLASVVNIAAWAAAHPSQIDLNMAESCREAWTVLGLDTAAAVEALRNAFHANSSGRLS